MNHDLPALLLRHREAFYLLFRHLQDLEERYLDRSQLVQEYERLAEERDGSALADEAVARLFHHAQEAVLDPPLLNLAVREDVARWRYLQIHTEEMRCRALDVTEYLAAKERAVGGVPAGERYTLEVDLGPFERDFPRVEEKEEIGRGVEFLNRHLSRRLGRLPDNGRSRLFEFLRVHHHRGRPLLLNGNFEEPADLEDGLRRAVQMLAEGPDGWEGRLRELGFAPGWGDEPARVREGMELLLDILDEPTPEALETFLGRLPMIFSIAILSPHGYFGQANVLGKPDTGGQVVYILDQVRALEEAMRASIRRQGLDIEPDIVVISRLIPEAGDTSCDQRLEPILGTERARILRVPFRDARGEVIPHWISRFEVWPYLERFAVEAQRELLAELRHGPDMVVGNYSDGNLVASIMAHRMGVTQCTIAHALEKTKYRGSDLRWKELEDEYHFSCQFTADLISMNAADFIITSTYQEIAGTEESVGQYESYGSFTLPGLYRVVSGVDCYDPKFNIVSPGADPRVFFPWSDRRRRTGELREEIREMVFGDCPDDHRGSYEDPDKPLLFAMSRLDSIKNMGGFVEWYARDDELRERANVLLVGGFLDPEGSADRDERRQIEEMHRLFDEHGLDGQVRWIEMQTDKNRVGAFYRFVADTRGAFVQPALFEAFGLTVVEAMSSGLPVFATCNGGPLEIVEDGVSGFHVDPHEPDQAARAMRAFFRRCEEDPDHWDRISRGAIERVQARYTWTRYADQLLRLSRIYGFWRYMSSLEREETWRYLEMFYGLMYRPLALGMGPPPSAREAEPRGMPEAAR